MKTRRLIHHGAAWLMVCGCLPAGAQAVIERTQLQRPVEAGITVALENDLFALRSKTDRWYTNGLHVAWHFKPGEEPLSSLPTQRFGRWLFDADRCRDDSGPTAAADCRVTVTYSFGQSMYTPRRIEDAAPQPLDRPWAGWLYAGGGVSTVDDNHHRVAAFKIGPTGPLSLAEQAQTYVHRHVSHSPKPLGWDNQLRPRLGVQLSYLSTWHFDIAKRFGANLSIGGSLGNLRTMARVGAGLTWSPTHALLHRIQPGTLDEGEFLVPDFDDGDASLLRSLRRSVLYAHVQAAGIARNAFISGDAFGGRSALAPIREVWTTTLGLAVPLPWAGGSRYKLGFAYKVRSPEFTLPGSAAGRDAYQRWGVLSLTWLNL